jgi:hypothetical protein
LVHARTIQCPPFHERKNLKHLFSSGHNILENREFVANSQRLVDRGGAENDLGLAGEGSSAELPAGGVNTQSSWVVKKRHADRR